MRKPLTLGQTVLYLSLFSVLAMWLRIGWVVFYPYKPFIVHSPFLEVVNKDKKVCAGGDLIVRAETEKTEAIETLVSTELVNTYSYTITPYWSDREVGRKTVTKTVPILSTAESGMYRIYRTFKTQVSWFPEYWVKASVWSEPFEVVR